jgi:hypothetical protein
LATPLAVGGALPLTPTVAPRRLIELSALLPLGPRPPRPFGLRSLPSCSPNVYLRRALSLLPAARPFLHSAWPSSQRQSRPPTDTLAQRATSSGGCPPARTRTQLLQPPLSPPLPSQISQPRPRPGALAAPTMQVRRRRMPPLLQPTTGPPSARLRAGRPSSTRARAPTRCSSAVSATTPSSRACPFSARASSASSIARRRPVRRYVALLTLSKGGGQGVSRTAAWPAAGHRPRGERAQRYRRQGPHNVRPEQEWASTAADDPPFSRPLTTVRYQAHAAASAPPADRNPAHPRARAARADCAASEPRPRL